MAVPMTITETWTEALGASRERVLSAARTGRHREALLAHATAGRIVAAWTLDPASWQAGRSIRRRAIRRPTSKRPTPERDATWSDCSRSRPAPKCARR